MEWWIPVVSTCVGAVVGAIAGAYAQERGARLQDELTRHRDRQRDDSQHRRSVLLERAAKQRNALMETNRLSALGAHSLQNEAEFAALRVRLQEAFASPEFADTVCDALDASMEAGQGSPSENAGLSVMACTTTMSRIIRDTDAAANASVPQFEDPMAKYDLALKAERKAFGELWRTSDSDTDSGTPP